MTLPTFVGIGVARGGTTWLHTLLSGHPDVYMPERRKEIRFFDRNYDQGTQWYEGFFCPQDEAARYTAIGEISPQYLYCESCPDRMSAALPDAKLLVILRHPVDRAYSHYGFVVQRRNFRGTFEEFLAERPTMLEKGFYSRYLDRYLARFERERMLALVFERAVRDIDSTRQALSSFLDVPTDRFPSSVDKVNASTIPRFGSLSSVVVTRAAPASDTPRADRRSRSASRRAWRDQQGQGDPTPRHKRESSPQRAISRRVRSSGEPIRSRRELLELALDLATDHLLDQTPLDQAFERAPPPRVEEVAVQGAGRSARELDRRAVVHGPLDRHLDAGHGNRVRTRAAVEAVVVAIEGVRHVPLVIGRVASHSVPTIGEDDACLDGTAAAVDRMVPILLRTSFGTIPMHDAHRLRARGMCIAGHHLETMRERLESLAGTPRGGSLVHLDQVGRSDMTTRRERREPIRSFVRAESARGRPVAQGTQRREGVGRLVAEEVVVSVRSARIAGIDDGVV